MAQTLEQIEQELLNTAQARVIQLNENNNRFQKLEEEIAELLEKDKDQIILNQNFNDRIIALGNKLKEMRIPSSVPTVRTTVKPSFFTRLKNEIKRH